VDRLLQAGLAEKEGDDIVHLTMLGQAVGSSSLSFESGLRLVELLRSVDIATTPPLHILAHVQVLQEMSDVYTPLMTRGRAESARVNDVIVRFGPAMSRLLQRYGADEHTFWRRCKRAAILFDWVEGVPVDSLERSYTANPFTAIRYGGLPVSPLFTKSLCQANRNRARSAAYDLKQCRLARQPSKGTSVNRWLASALARIACRRCGRCRIARCSWFDGLHWQAGQTTLNGPCRTLHFLHRNAGYAIMGQRSCNGVFPSHVCTSKIY
jgi:hypothetical protein